MVNAFIPISKSYYQFQSIRYIAHFHIYLITLNVSINIFLRKVYTLYTLLLLLINEMYKNQFVNILIALFLT